MERLDILGNQLGDSVDLLIDVFKKNGRIRTMLGIVEGTTALDLSKRDLDPAYVRLLAVELNSTRATAVVESLDVSNNHLIGLDEYGDGTEDHAGWDALCKVLSKSAVKTFKAASTQLNPKATTTLAAALSIDSKAVLEVLDISGNAITGGMISYDGSVDFGDDITGITALSEAMSASKIKNLAISNCGLGPQHNIIITILASTLSTV